ncbi:MAG: MFS transporter [Gammaproteobacteria bacterium]|nr:MFS transporter [Gammaproteobacteria bacterium]
MLSRHGVPYGDYDSRAYRGYVLAVLTAVYALNFIDRQLLVILQEPIKLELGLSDTQLGLLSGLAFPVFYVICGIPIARLAESRSRRNVIAFSIVAWSVMTAVCGLAQNYTQLLLARMGVGVGESGGSPPSHSMISDMYPPGQRSTALSIFSTGVNIGILGGFLLGAWLNEFFGWRSVFLLVGLPGVLFALLVGFTVAEPARGRSDPHAREEVPPTVGQAVRLLWSKPTFRYVALACAMQSFGMYGMGSWFPSYLIRTHGMSVVEVGTWLALLAGGVGALGALAGGYLTDYLGQRDRRWYLWVPMIAGIVVVPFALAAFLVDSGHAALALNALPLFLSYMYLGPTLAVAHSLVGARMRALTSALMFFVLNLIGMGLGPLFTGLTSDLLMPAVGADSLRYALIATLALASLGGTLMYLGGAHHLRTDLARAGGISAS